MNNNNDIVSMIQEFKKGGWIMAVLGSLGMLARLILIDEKYDFFIWLRKVIAGGITGVIVYFALYGSSLEPIYKSVICSISGSIAPELFEWIRNKVKFLKTK